MNSHLIISAEGEAVGVEPASEFMWWNYKCSNITGAHFKLEKHETHVLYIIISLQLNSHNQDVCKTVYKTL